MDLVGKTRGENEAVSSHGSYDSVFPAPTCQVIKIGRPNSKRHELFAVMARAEVTINRFFLRVGGGTRLLGIGCVDGFRCAWGIVVRFVGAG